MTLKTKKKSEFAKLPSGDKALLLVSYAILGLFLIGLPYSGGWKKGPFEASWHVDACTDLSAKDYLKRLKERSFKHLYHNSTSCFIRLKGNMLEITKYELHPSGRYLQECPEKVSLLIDEVGWDGALQIIMSILNQENDSNSR